ncbi:hypothetical protein GCM10010404_80950 [Nonomuraea africana]|uniref:Uncharacterized protein n=1 Tax=Nonomuraea africana TaxID=46171 RepID=A0ABR9KWW0_9ACTN|nr:hypothetical protein [Nonomuraea africana]MBE1566527.1 hypothetical protein [Nonomuraea africana]
MKHSTLAHLLAARQLDDHDHEHHAHIGAGSQTIKICLWSSSQRPELARAYFDAIAPHLEQGWSLDVAATFGRPVVRSFTIWRGPAQGEPEPVKAQDAPLPTPSGCRHCGLEKRDHMGRWKSGAGWHGWVEPTDEQRKARMLDRRARRAARQ